MVILKDFNLEVFFVCYNIDMINKWHKWLAMVQRDQVWYVQDMAEELEEYYDEKHIIKRWSELSDVVYSYTRGRSNGHTLTFPFSSGYLVIGLIYMFPKYTGRWLFFRSAGKKVGSKMPIHEVRNPRKTYKLHEIAERYEVDVKKFQEICETQLKHWVLLP